MRREGSGRERACEGGGRVWFVYFEKMVLVTDWYLDWNGVEEEAALLVHLIP